MLEELNYCIIPPKGPGLKVEVVVKGAAISNGLL